MRPSKYDVAAGLAFVAMAVWLSWPLVPRFTTALSASPDSLLNYWALAWNFHVLPRAPLSLFDANIFAPRPDTLAYSEHMVGVALATWPLYLVSSNVIVAYNGAVFLSFVLSGVGAYLLVRDLTGSAFAGFVSGLILLAAPYRMLHVLHLQLLTYHWLVWVLWCRPGSRR